MSKTLFACTFLVFGGLLANPSGSSFYTDTDKNCTSLSASENGSEELCPGPGGYGLRISDTGNIIQIELTSGKRSILLGQAHNIGTKAEWRYSRDRSRPYALIIRLYYRDESSGTVRTFSELVVARISDTEICPVAKIRGTNMEARNIADRAADMKCLQK